MDMAGVPTLRKALTSQWILVRCDGSVPSWFWSRFDPKMITVSVDRRERREATASHKSLDRLGPVDVWCGGL